MFILANEDSSIESITTIPNGTAIEYSGNVPVDLYDTYALGKYKFIDGVIVDLPI